jgi:hypothetical protein
LNYLRLDYSNIVESISAENKSKSFDPQHKIPKLSVKSHKKEVNVYVTFIKQTIKSHLTICQFALFLLNIAGIITIVIISTLIKKRVCSSDSIFKKMEIFKSNIIMSFF